VLLPFLSGAFCFWVGYEVIKQSGAAASASVLVAMALGVPLIVVARRATHGDFFHRPAIAYNSIEPSPDSTTAGLRRSFRVAVKPRPCWPGSPAPTMTTVQRQPPTPKPEWLLRQPRCGRSGPAGRLASRASW
jgi:hypothetical protein